MKVLKTNPVQKNNFSENDNQTLEEVAWLLWPETLK